VFVDHFSLPAFDATGQAEHVPAVTIKRNKIDIGGNSIVVSRLNPRINRTWWACPTPGVPALASTELAVLTTDSDAELAALWLAARAPRFREELPQRVTGT
jgi:type I restriction enzyme S subunit